MRYETTAVYRDGAAATPYRRIVVNDESEDTMTTSDGMVVYSDTADSYDAGASAARRDAQTMDDRQLAHIVGVLRAYEAAEATNRFARAYANGALDALAPFMLYTEVA